MLGRSRAKTAFGGGPGKSGKRTAAHLEGTRSFGSRRSGSCARSKNWRAARSTTSTNSEKRRLRGVAPDALAGVAAGHVGELALEGEGDDVARIGFMQALNRGHVREFNPSRKDHHWGRRKLVRDR
jgi:hypothetical protein